jgi:hypothetical protein
MKVHGNKVPFTVDPYFCGLIVAAWLLLRQATNFIIYYYRLSYIEIVTDKKLNIEQGHLKRPLFSFHSV